MLVACKAPDLMYEPRPDDPLDGYAGGLTQAGVNTEIDWGPKQTLLLSGYQALKEQEVKLRRDLEASHAENRNLQARLNQEGDALQHERTLRVQAEAEVQNLRNRRRDLEARILSLGIEKAKLEQAALLGKIANLQRTLEDISPSSGVPAAPPGGTR